MYAAAITAESNKATTVIMRFIINAIIIETKIIAVARRKIEQNRHGGQQLAIDNGQWVTAKPGGRVPDNFKKSWKIFIIRAKKFWQ
jgi:hypothetical protein